MAAKPLTTEGIALTEKKMDMKLDDIIQMSKNIKARKQRRVPNKSQKFSNTLTQDKSSKVRSYMESRSSIRQGVLAKRRSNFQGNQFPIATEVARKAGVAPLSFRVSNHNKVASWNKARFRVPVSQRRAASGGFTVKEIKLPVNITYNRQSLLLQKLENQSFPSPQQQQQQDVNIMPKQKPQTLDSLFANMKEQRMRVLSRQNNAVQHNRGGSRRLAWGRGRFGN